MGVSATTASGIRYPTSADTVVLYDDLRLIMESVEGKTVIRGASSFTTPYVNDVGVGWLAAGSGSGTGGGIRMTNTTPADVNNRTWGMYARTGGELGFATYDSTGAWVGAQMSVARNGRVTIGADPTGLLDVATKQYTDGRSPSGHYVWGHTGTYNPNASGAFTVVHGQGRPVVSCVAIQKTSGAAPASFTLEATDSTNLNFIAWGEATGTKITSGSVGISLVAVFAA
jgi:hypothetical protein